MYYITIKGEINDYQARSLAFLTNMKCYWDERYKRYEFRGVKKEHGKYLKMFEEFGKIFKSKIHDWVEKEGIYKSKYREIK